jgi:hypothetical protein
MEPALFFLKLQVCATYGGGCIPPDHMQRDGSRNGMYIAEYQRNTAIARHILQLTAEFVLMITTE